MKSVLFTFKLCDLYQSDWSVCPGDSGDMSCLGCPGCVLDWKESVEKSQRIFT